MAWIAVDEDGCGCICEEKPVRNETYWLAKHGWVDNLTDKTIAIIVGSLLTWEDEPVEVGCI